MAYYMSHVFTCKYLDKILLTINYLLIMFFIHKYLTKYISRDIFVYSNDIDALSLPPG